MRKEIIWLILILIVGAFLRVYKLDAKEYRLDELSFVMIPADFDDEFKDLYFSKHYFGKELKYVDLPSLPLPFLVMKEWILLYGKGEIQTRLLSVIIGVGSILVFFCMGRAIMRNTLAAVLSSLLFVVNPIMIEFSRTARMYSQAIFFSLLSWYFFFKVFMEGERNNKFIFLYAIFTFLSVSSHYFNFISALSQGIVILIIARNKAKSYLKAGMIIFILLLPWFHTVISEKLATLGVVINSLNWIPAPSIPRVIESISYILFSHSIKWHYQLAVVGLLIFLFYFGKEHLGYRMWITLNLPILLTYVFMILPYLTAFKISLLNYDYLSLIIPLFLLVAFAGVERIKKIGRVIITIYLLSIILSIPSYYAPNREISSLIKQVYELDPEADIRLYPEYYNYYTYYYLPEKYILGSSEWSLSQIRNSLLNAKKVWLIFIHINKPDLAKDYKEVITLEINKTRDIKVTKKGMTDIIYMVRRS